MKDCKLQIITVQGADQEGLTAVQKKLNQWVTTGLLRKYKTDVVGDHIVFHICLKKEA